MNNNNTQSLANEQRKVWYKLSKQELVLVVVTMFWGSTFLLVQTALQYSGPLFFVGFRFFSAGVIALILFRKQLAQLTWYELLAGVSIGFVLCLGYSLQTAGLKTIESSKSAFITAMYVPAVPFLQWLVLRVRPPFMRWVGIFLTFIGVIFISAPPNAFSNGLKALFDFGAGEWLTLAGALGIAFEIILISKFAGSVKIGCVTTIQLLACAIFSFAAMPFLGEGVPPFSWILVLFAVGMGAMSVAVQFAMNWAQRTISPTRATIIYAGEPIWGGVVGCIAGERLPWLALLGGAFIVIGVLVSELRLAVFKRKNTEK